MAKKKHWAASTDDPTAGRKFRLACGMRAWINSANMSGPLWSLCSAAVYRDLAACDPDWYCVTCAKAARLALAKEQPIAVSFSSAVRRCARCRSGAINPSDHGRTEGVDLDLCDVCYWRKRAESATWPNTINGHTHQCPKCIEIFLCLNPSCDAPGGVGADKRCHCADVERYAELRRLVEDWQNPFPGNPSPYAKTESEATQALRDWRHR